MPATSVRGDGTLEVSACSSLVEGVGTAVEKALTEEGVLGVIAEDATLEARRGVLPNDPRVVLVPARLAKGLEFDHVVLVEPAEIVESPSAGHRERGLRHLYVAITRTVSHLTVVHRGPLPPELGTLGGS
ncbi:MAG: hypothetical protein Q8Q02_03010 [Nocardioides sp.]|nr:hypothetical protein [Nocardioides sp.]